MLKFLFDCGNTCIKFALYEEGKPLTAHRFVEYNELSYFIQSLFEHYPQPSEIRIASVTTETRLKMLCELMAIHSSIQPLIAISQQNTQGLENGYDYPDKLGVDRWLGILAARKHYQDQPLLVVDLGTALTIDYVSPFGKFEGGVILPGMKSMKDALLKDTTLKIPHELPYKNELGKNTADCISAGIYYALVGAITSIYDAVAVKPLIILSGGRAEWLADILSKHDAKFDIKVHKHLVLEGLLEFTPN